jgi:hypothetical protein
MLPKQLRHNLGLAWAAKVIWSDLVESMNSEGEAEITVDALASIYETEPGTIRTYIKQLAEAGYLTSAKDGHRKPLLAPGVSLEQIPEELRPKRTPNTLTATLGPTEFDKYVQAFWSRYPKRNGKHLNKRLGQNELNKISSEEIEKVLIGAANFAKSKQAIDGFAPDAHRWLRRKEWESWQDGPTRERNRATL